MTVNVQIPHAGQDTHTLLVAIEIDDDRLDDPSLSADVLAEVARLVTDTLDARRMDADLAAVCEQVGTSIEQVRGRDVSRDTSRARHDVYLALRRRGWSLPAIGRAVERDHTSVLSGIRKAEQRDAQPIVRDGCEDCGEPSLANGRWCLKCFQGHAKGDAA